MNRVIGAGTFVLLASLSQVASAANDEVGPAWRARAETASRNLSRGRLDACDMALEKAFANVEETNDKPFRSFHLVADVQGQSLHVAYSYRGTSLASFELIALPSPWVARQRVNSKTLSLLVAPARCAIDLCTNDPFAQGACPGDPPE